VNQLVPIISAALPTLVAATGEQASIRFLEFFTANIRNSHTRRAYARAAGDNAVLFVDQHRVGEAKFADRGGDLRDLLSLCVRAFRA
jgi:hypothetical protein